MSVKVVETRTTYNRILTLEGADTIEFGGAQYLPTALRYSWWTSQPKPSSVEVVTRKLKRDGTLGRETRILSYALGTPSLGCGLAPEWVAQLVTTGVDGK